MSGSIRNREAHAALLTLTWGALSLGCAATSETPTDSTTGLGGAQGSNSAAPTSPSTVTSVAGSNSTNGGAGIGNSTGGASAGGTAPAAGGTAPAGGASSGNGLPCAVNSIVEAKCVACHSDPPVGTFMALTTQAHFQAQGTSDVSKKYYQLAKARINAATKPMPPVTSPKLTTDELAALNAWLDQGAPASNETCSASAAPAAPSAASGNEIDTKGLECHKFLAHAQGNKNAKFKVGVAVDAYFNFGFKAPWTGTAYGLVVKPVVDNAKVLHHWLLYREDAQDGSVVESGGQHSGGELIHGWAPGGIAADFRKSGDVSFELPPTSYVVEFHYNSSDANAEDASGVEICLQHTPTKNIAGMSWVGYDQGIEAYAAGAVLGTGFSEFCLDPQATWVGTCAPESQEPIHIIFVTPHMHTTGRRMKAVINGPNGQRVLHDEPFDFSYQVGYEKSEVLMPGETITTTCSFSEPKCAGQATGTEMCYLFTYAWPKGALRDSGAWGQVAHGEGSCLGQ